MLTTFQWKIWKFTTSKLYRELGGHQHRIISICFAQSDAILISASDSENAIRAWDVEAGILLRVVHVEGVVDVGGSPHHPFVVLTSDQDQSAMVFNAEDGRRFPLPASAGAVAFAFDGRSIVTGCWGDSEQGLRTWDLQPLLKDRDPEKGQILEPNDDEAIPADGPESVVLKGTLLDGPQVRLGLFVCRRY